MDIIHDSSSFENDEDEMNIKRNKNYKNKKTVVFANILEDIKSLYKKSCITAEDRIKLKKLIISKSKTLFTVYENYLKKENEYKEKKYEILAGEFKKIIDG